MYWVYKNNAQNPPYQVAVGNWDDFFLEGRTAEWGSTEWSKDLRKARLGDTILAYQTDKNELVGIAKVAGWRKRGLYRDLFLRPVRRIGVKVRPLRLSDRKVAAIPALRPGPIRTLYEISSSDSQRLLRAAGIHIGAKQQARKKTTKLVRTGAGFGSFEQNQKTEKAGILRVTKHLRSRGWRVNDVSPQKLGYDLLCQKGKAVLHVEVKGIGGATIRFIITAAERTEWQTDPRFVLAAVTNACKASAKITFFKGLDSLNRFRFQAISYMASGAM